MQIIPANATFSTLLGQVLGQLPGQVLQGYQQAGQAASQQQGLDALLRNYAPQLSEQDRSQIARSNFNPKDLISALQGLQKSSELSEIDPAKRQRAETLLGTLEEMESLLPYTGSTSIPFTSSFNAIPEGLNRSGLEKRNTFDALAADIASFFRDLEAKGQLPQGLYEKLIEPRLPSSKLSERENLGRIKGARSLARRFGGLQSEESSLPRELKVQSESQKERPPLETIWNSPKMK